MKYQILIASVLSLAGVLAQASTYSCTAWGTYEGNPSPGNTHGVYSELFTGTGPSSEEAQKNALAQCQSGSMESCRLDSCRELILLSPKPLGPDTEISCADDSGIQVEILVSPPHYQRTAIVSKNNIQITAFGIDAYTPSNESYPTQYESESSTYSLQLSVRNNHLFFSGPNLYSDGFVTCIKRAPVPPAPLPPHHHCNPMAGC